MDLRSNEDTHRLDRRQFFVRLGGGSLVAAGVGAGAFAVQYLSPNVLYEVSPLVSVGRPEHFPTESVTLDPQFGIFVVRSARGFYALTAVCSHLGCLTVWKQDAGVIECPCHGSSFRCDGSIIGGPAAKPLAWLKMWLTDDGELMVDRSVKLTPEQAYVRT
ncbi:MAG TPA: Rieske 2Fe-2S domain-containing protein [Terriglobales bacterium]|nr:Rieske 2Fe-2S domain-containing protein [Terriglobales bacterium]